LCHASYLALGKDWEKELKKSNLTARVHWSAAMALRRWTSVLVTTNTTRPLPGRRMPSPGCQQDPVATARHQQPVAASRPPGTPDCRRCNLWEKMEDRDEREREIEECTEEGEEGICAGGRGRAPAPHRSHCHTPSSWIPPPHNILMDPVAGSRVVHRI
jgi:hypothetical protein